LTFKAVRINGKCPVYNIGEKTVINGPFIDLENSDKVCVHALLSLGSFIVALREGIDPMSVGLSKNQEGPAYFQCLDPGPPWTDGGTILFEVTSVQGKND
jgi:uncharacterized repeat protein (TIGR04076 family)